MYTSNVTTYNLQINCMTVLDYGVVERFIKFKDIFLISIVHFDRATSFVFD